LLSTDKETCPNCGALIAQQFIAAQQSAAAEQFMNPFEPDVPAPNATISRANGDTLHLPPPPDEEPPSSSDQPTDKMRALQVYRGNSLTVPRQSQDAFALQPYQSAQVAPFDPRGLQEIGGELASTPQLTPLPGGLPKRPPDIMGVVIHVQSQMENPIMPDSAEFFFKLVRDLIWAVPYENQQESRTVNVTTVRVRLSNGAQKDGRVEGYMRGVNISLGDTVSLWGHKRRGLLLIYRGYNHTAKGIVKTTASATALTIFLLLILCIGIFYTMLVYLHIHLPLPFLPH